MQLRIFSDHIGEWWEEKWKIFDDSRCFQTLWNDIRYGGRWFQLKYSVSEEEAISKWNCQMIVSGEMLWAKKKVRYGALTVKSEGGCSHSRGSGKSWLYNRGVEEMWTSGRLHLCIARRRMRIPIRLRWIRVAYIWCKAHLTNWITMLLRKICRVEVVVLENKSTQWLSSIMKGSQLVRSSLAENYFGKDLSKLHYRIYMNRLNIDWRGETDVRVLSFTSTFGKQERNVDAINGIVLI